jgi:hypothetical protein
MGWILARGTGLALRLGHRVSEDFDFFRTEGMETDRLFQAISGIGSCDSLQHSERTLTVLLRGVKMSFFQVADPFLFPATEYSFFRVADIRDIALMKLLAITNRGSRKDFIDMCAILRHGVGLKDCLDLMVQKHGHGRLNPYQVVLGLGYFADAEAEPMPDMLEDVDWEDCKARLVRAAAGIVLPPAEEP